MADFGVILSHLERRARQIQALAWGGTMLFAGGASVLAAAWVLRAFSCVFPRPWLIALGAPCLLAAGGYTIGRLRSVHLPTILLRADVALGLDARLSTLYQIQNRSVKAPFANRIAASLPSAPLNWRRAVPVRPRDVILLIAGVALAAMAIVLGDVPVRDEAVGELSAEPLAVASIAVDDSVPSAALAGDPMGQELEPDDTREVTGSSFRSVLALEDILAEIRPQDSGETGNINGPDLEDLLPRARSHVSLEEILREIQGRLAPEGGVFSVSEVEALEAFLNVASGLLAEALERILDGVDGEASLALIANLLADEDLRRQSRNLHLDSEERVPQERPEGSDKEGDSPAVASDSPPALSGLALDARPVGGEAAEPSPGGEIPAFPLFEGSAEYKGDIVVVGVALPSTIGDEGAYTYYLTKGVPIEPPSTSDESDGGSLSFSYEKIDSIVSGRALPSDVLGTVRAYFDRISEGGS